jgi:hypothetical protein
MDMDKTKNMNPLEELQQIMEDIKIVTDFVELREKGEVWVTIIADGKDKPQENPKGKELFDMVYQWGRVGVVTDHTCNAYQEKLKELIKEL